MKKEKQEPVVLLKDNKETIEVSNDSHKLKTGNEMIKPKGFLCRSKLIDGMQFFSNKRSE